MLRRACPHARPPWLATVLAGLAVSLPLAAQAGEHCDPEVLRNAPSGESQGYMDRSDRCEGIYASDVSGSELWLASLTEIFEDYELNAEPLTVSWSGPADQPVRIRAVGTESGLYYRMDRAHPAGTTEFKWDSELLEVRRIDKARLGVLAWREGQSEPLMVPVRVTQSAADPPWTGTYTAVIMPQVSLREVFVTLAKVEEPGDLPNGPLLRDQEPLDQRLFQARRPFHVPLDGLTEVGVYYVKITGRQAGGATADMDPFWFLHTGN